MLVASFVVLLHPPSPPPSPHTVPANFTSHPCLPTGNSSSHHLYCEWQYPCPFYTNMYPSVHPYFTSSNSCLSHPSTTKYSSISCPFLHSHFNTYQTLVYFPWRSLLTSASSFCHLSISTIRIYIPSSAPRNCTPFPCWCLYFPWGRIHKMDLTEISTLCLSS